MSSFIKIERVYNIKHTQRKKKKGGRRGHNPQPSHLAI
jgi:hypothetical protein